MIARVIEMGPDEYIVKPFSPTELAARIRAVLCASGSRLSPRNPTCGAT